MNENYYCKCPKCGNDYALVDMNSVYYSNPPRYMAKCPHCGCVFLVLEDDIYSETSIMNLKKIKNYVEY